MSASPITLEKIEEVEEIFNELYTNFRDYEGDIPHGAIQRIDKNMKKVLNKNEPLLFAWNEIIEDLHVGASANAWNRMELFRLTLIRGKDALSSSPMGSVVFMGSYPL